MSRSQLSTLCVLSLVSTVLCQLIIPKRPLGYVYNGGSSDAPINLDVHMGPLCPDSRDAFPNLKKVADGYGPTTLKLTLHMFPLPYHHQAYLTAIGAHAVKSLSSVDGAYKWFDKIYNEKLDFLSNDATSNMTTNEVIRLLARYAFELGISETDFLAAMKSEERETETRTAWKYSCTRSVAGTPTFFLNDVPLAADPTWTVSEWKEVIDPLLKPVDKVAENKSCPVGTKACNYLPGKVECCTKGEGCIPDVGCRCFGNGCFADSKVKVRQSCPLGTKKCEYLPGKEECCKKGEACIPDVGCRCSTFACKIRKQNEVPRMVIEPSN